MRRLLLFLVVLASIGAAGCGDDEPTTPTSASTEESVDATTRLFAGTLAPRGSAFYSFTVSQSSDVLVTLASLTAAGDRAPLPVPLVLGLGYPAAPHVPRPRRSKRRRISALRFASRALPACIAHRWSIQAI